ncbi:MAG: hypothetical protein RLZ35_35 [Pseudomonadota bacterium]|jgi:hypothetical protein
MLKNGKYFSGEKIVSFKQKKRIKVLSALRCGAFEEKPYEFLPLLINDPELQQEFIYVLFTELRINSAAFQQIIVLLNQSEIDAKRNGEIFLLPNIDQECNVIRNAIHLAILNEKPAHVVDALLGFGISIKEDIRIDQLCIGYPEWKVKLAKYGSISVLALADVAGRKDLFDILSETTQALAEKKAVEIGSPYSAFTKTAFTPHYQNSTSVSLTNMNGKMVNHIGYVDVLEDGTKVVHHGGHIEIQPNGHKIVPVVKVCPQR